MRCLLCVSIFCFIVLILPDTLLAVKNKKPIIGVIAQELKNGRNNKSFVAASYVKALEASGARVIPIFINKTESYYRETLSYINGVVIPGGSALFNVTGGFGSAVINTYNIVKEMNEKEGQMFPILGVCQGMEILSYIASNQKSPLVPCDADNMNIPLNFKPDYRNSTLYRYLLPQFSKILEKYPVTNNHHYFCLTEENFNKFGMDKGWKLLSTNKDRKGLQFVSSIESKTLPIAGVQFHPEKPAYEWNPVQHNTHDFRAVLVNRHFYDWVVNMAKSNDHQFPDKNMEKKRLIYNYPVTYTPEDYDLQMYFFKS